METHKRSGVQRLMLALAPAGSRAAIEADSRSWIVECSACGADRSVWELGGIRAGASGSPRWMRQCQSCGDRNWHRVHWTGGDPALTNHDWLPRLVFFIVAAALLLTAGVAAIALKTTGVI